MAAAKPRRVAPDLEPGFDLHIGKPCAESEFWYLWYYRHGEMVTLNSGLPLTSRYLALVWAGNHKARRVIEHLGTNTTTLSLR